MIDQMFLNARHLYQSWARTTATMVRGQWLMVEAGMYAANQALAVASQAPLGMGFSAPRQAEPAPGTGRKEELATAAARRMTQGLPPPRAVYEAQNRDEIDWSLFPIWARPIDPDVFAGCAHEG